MNNKEKGTDLENYVAHKLQEVLQESPEIRATKASSGGQHNTEIADINSQFFYIECKNHEGKFFDRKVWENLLNDIPLGSTKIPLYIIRDQVEGELVMLSFTDFCSLLKK